MDECICLEDRERTVCHVTHGIVHREHMAHKRAHIDELCLNATWLAGFCAGRKSHAGHREHNRTTERQLVRLPQTPDGGTGRL